MDLSSMLPFLMMNKDGNKDMMGMINALNAMKGGSPPVAGMGNDGAGGGSGGGSGGGMDILSMMNMLNSMRQPQNTASATSNSGANGESNNDYIKDNCKEPKFWNSPARECGSETTEPAKEPPKSPFGADSSMGNLAPLLSMMNNGGAGGGSNPLLSMLPFLMNNNGNNNKTAKTVSVGNPFDPVRHFCPLPIRMKLNYYLAK